MTEDKDYSGGAKVQQSRDKIRQAREEIEKALEKWANLERNMSVWKGVPKDPVMESYENAYYDLGEALGDNSIEEMYEDVETAVHSLEDVEKNVKATHPHYYGWWRNAVDLLLPVAETLDNTIQGDDTEEEGGDHDHIDHHRGLTEQVSQLRNK